MGQHRYTDSVTSQATVQDTEANKLKSVYKNRNLNILFF